MTNTPDFDAYIESSGYCQRKVTFICPACEELFYVLGVEEFGSWEAHEYPILCPECGFDLSKADEEWQKELAKV